MTKQRLVPFADKSGKRHDNFYIDPETNILYFKKGHAGKKIKFSTKYKSNEFIQAKRFANKEFNRRIGKAPDSVVHPLIKDELSLWLNIKESEGLAYDTLNNVKRAAKQIEEYWGSRFPSEFVRENMPGWFAWWKVNKPGIEMENAIKYARNFSRYLNQKVVNGKPLLAVVPEIKDPNYKTIRRRRKKKKENILSEQDMRKIFKAAPDGDMALATLIMYTMATRVTETLEMRFDDEIDLDHEPPRYRWSDGQNKADLDGWHALHPKLVPLLRSLKSRREADGTNRLFPQKFDNQKALKEQQVDWHSWRHRAGIKFHWTPHTFRHTCLSNLFNDPKNPQALICKLYRVSLAVALDTYVKPTDEGRKLMQEAIRVQL